MDTNHNYEQCYSILGLRPDSSWAEVRRNYRNLLKKWHPDRFEDLSDKHRQAEERTKEITKAYKALADYHRKHSVLPDVSPPAPPHTPDTAETGHAERDEQPGSDLDHADDRTPASDVQSDEPVGPQHARSVRWRTVAGLSFAVLIIALWLSETPGTKTTPDADETGSGTSSPASVPGGHSESNSGSKLFRRGSTIGEVYSAQGIPTNTGDGFWEYGKSKIYIANGVVTHWEEHPDNPLRVPAVDQQEALPLKDIFTRGSTKNEVRAIQGIPWHQTEEEWRYGSSRVFFSGGLVTGWEESPLNPLKIDHTTGSYSSVNR